VRGPIPRPRRAHHGPVRTPRMRFTSGDLVRASREPVCLAGVHLVRRGEADDGCGRTMIDGRLVSAAFAASNRGEKTGDVLAALDVLHVPAVRLIALAAVLGSARSWCRPHRDVFLVVDDHEVAQALLCVPASDERLDVTPPQMVAGRTRTRRLWWSNLLVPRSASGSNSPLRRAVTPLSCPPLHSSHPLADSSRGCPLTPGYFFVPVLGVPGVREPMCAGPRCRPVPVP